MPACLERCGILPCGERYGHYKEHVCDIQRMMVRILHDSADWRRKQQALRLANERNAAPTDKSNNTDAKAKATKSDENADGHGGDAQKDATEPDTTATASSLADAGATTSGEQGTAPAKTMEHQLVEIIDDKGQTVRWECARCEMFRKPRYRPDFYKEPCVPKGFGTRMDKRVARRQQELHAEWRKKKPGGHQLSWDGDPYGIISCARCTRTWQHNNNQIWNAQIWQRCTGNGEAEEKRRKELREELEKWQQDQPASGNPHQLVLEEATDLVMCRTCSRRIAPGAWRRFLGNERCAGAAELGRRIEDAGDDTGKIKSRRQNKYGRMEVAARLRAEASRTGEEEPQPTAGGRRLATKAAAYRRGAGAPTRTGLTGRSTPAAPR